jgi:hypothetical protein
MNAAKKYSQSGVRFPVQKNWTVSFNYGQRRGFYFPGVQQSWTKSCIIGQLICFSKSIRGNTGE